MPLSTEALENLFYDGFFGQIAEGTGITNRESLDVRTRVLVANALALTGEIDEAARLVNLQRESNVPVAVRSQAEVTLGLTLWRRGDVAAALQHFQLAVRFAQDSGDSRRLAWAHLYRLRLLIEAFPPDV